MEREKFLSAVYLIIRNSEGKILLQRRQNTKLWLGFLALPAGHIDCGENAYEAKIFNMNNELKPYRKQLNELLTWAMPKQIIIEKINI